MSTQNMQGFRVILVAHKLEKKITLPFFLLAFALIWLSQKIKQFEKLHESTRVHRTKVRRRLSTTYLPYSCEF